MLSVGEGLLVVSLPEPVQRVALVNISTSHVIGNSSRIPVCDGIKSSDITESAPELLLSSRLKMQTRDMLKD